jgi:hypothetical protein
MLHSPKLVCDINCNLLSLRIAVVGQEQYTLPLRLQDASSPPERAAPTCSMPFGGCSTMALM